MLTLILVLMLLKGLFSYKKTIGKQGIAIVVTSLFVNSFLILIYRLELTSLNLLTYFSDAELYYNQGKELLNYGVKSTSDFLGYKFIVFLTLKFGLFKTPFELNIVNLLFFYNSIIYLIEFARKITFSSLTREQTNFALFFILFNPLIVYSLFRNLKDSYFLFIIALLIKANTNHNLKSYIKITINALATPYLISIRPWSFIVPFGIYIFDIYSRKQKSHKNFNYLIVLFFVATTTIVIFWYLKGDYINMWINHLESNDVAGIEEKVGFSLTDKLLGPFRLLLGPGPYRPLFPEKYFLYYLKCGNVMIEFGILLWYLFISTLIANFKGFDKEKFKLLSPIVFVISCYLIIYAFAYSGAVEIRFRGQLFPLMIVLLTFSLSKNIKWTPSRTILTISIFVAITMFSTFISL